uniref:Uncharacterized protein n=1 Tax=Plectus sambesii TaxID=2011161 RepID=A0A914XGD2_9BILA
MTLLSLIISSLVVFASSLTSAAVQEQCDEGFVFSSQDNRCYYASHKALTWEAANQACHELNSQLVVIPDHSTQGAVDLLLSSHSRLGVYWIGRQRKGGVELWLGKHPLKHSNLAKKSTVDHIKCAGMVSGKTDRAVQDYFSCTNKYFFICQAACCTSTSTSSSTTRTTPKTSRTTPTTTRSTTRMTTTGPNKCPSAGQPVYGPLSGIVSSPNYPSQYFNNANCVYTIIMQSGAATLTFNAFNTEACCDFLYIYNGPTTSYPLIKKLSGTGYAGTTYKATSNSMTLWFTTDASGTSSGWQANYYSS